MKNNKKIYVVCTSNFKTGGTELLHQLVKSINDNNGNAIMAYYGKSEQPLNDAFKCYINSYIKFEDIIDDEDNIIVFPEIYINLEKKFKKSKKYIWWLSVDNFITHNGFYNTSKKWGLIAGLKSLLKGRVSLTKYKPTNNAIHLCQSYYAINFLKELGINDDKIMYLSDYLNDTYLNINCGEFNERKDIVLYNPVKGYEFTKKIIENSNFEWVPIKNMTTEQVKDLLLESKVYIDFGNHPGKDRFPREAAICGCCVITGKRGSAKFYEDVMIPECYKFTDKDENIESIIAEIDKCLNNYDKNIKDFEDYRNMIKSEKDKFNECVKKIFF